MINVTIKDGNDIRALREMVDGRLIDRIMRQSMTDIVRKYSTKVKRDLSRRTGLPQKLFTPRIKLGKTVVRRDGSIRASLWVGTLPIPLIKTLREPALRRGRLSMVSRDAFMATMPNNYNGIFQRKPAARYATGRDAKGRVKKNRLPIKEAMFSYRAVAEDILQKIAAGDEFASEVFERFTRKFDQYMNRKIA